MFMLSEQLLASSFCYSYVAATYDAFDLIINVTFYGPLQEKETDSRLIYLSGICNIQLQLHPY